MKKGQININYAPRNIAILNKEALVGQADRYSTIEYKSIIAYAAKAAAVPESSIEMAMEAIFDAVNYFVLNGHSVQIPNLGTFSIGVRAKGAMNTQDFTANFNQNLRNVHINFLPDPELKQMLASTAINTSATVPEGYSSAGVISVSGAMFKRGNLALPINEGLCYGIEEITGLVISGSRLVSSWIGDHPLFITFIDSAGEEEVAIICTEAFMDNAFLRKVTVGNFVTAISDNSFKNCSALEEVELGGNVRIIGAESFKNCPKLMLVNAHGMWPAHCPNVFDDAAKQNAKLYVPRGQVMNYKRRLEWRDFKNVQEY